jgi:hypothetical protein
LHDCGTDPGLLRGPAGPGESPAVRVILVVTVVI